MKRKIIRLGESTDVISLPKNWVENHDLEPKNELEVEEKENHLIVSTEEDKGPRKTTLDLRDLPGSPDYGIGSLYMRGYDEIKVLVDDMEMVSKISREFIPQLIGFEIVEEGPNSVVIKDVTDTGEMDVNKFIERIFMLLNSMAEVCKGSDEDFLQQIESADTKINKFMFLCLRLLNKRGAENPEDTPTLYFMIKQLESIADEYKHTAENIQKEELGETAKEFLERTNDLLKSCKSLFFDYDMEEFIRTRMEYDSMKEEIESAVGSTDPGQQRILISIEKTADYIMDLMIIQQIIEL